MTITAESLIGPDSLSALLRDGAEVELIDVRSPAEFESAHIGGAVNIPLDVLSGAAARIRSQVAAPVVLVCQEGPRAVQARQHLNAAGLADAKILDGGMRRWDDSTRPVKRGVQRLSLERQVRLVAGGLVLAGIAASVVKPKARFLSGAIGVGLTFSALSNTCAMGNVLSRLPYNRGADYDADAALARVGAHRGRSCGARSPWPRTTGRGSRSSSPSPARTRRWPTFSCR